MCPSYGLILRLPLKVNAKVNACYFIFKNFKINFFPKSKIKVSEFSISVQLK